MGKGVERVRVEGAESARNSQSKEKGHRVRNTEERQCVHITTCIHDSLF